MWSHRVESLNRFTSHHHGFVVVSSRSRISHILQVSHRAHRLPAVRAYRLTAGGKIFHKRCTEDFTYWAVILLQSHTCVCNKNALQIFLKTSGNMRARDTRCHSPQMFPLGTSACMWTHSRACCVRMLTFIENIECFHHPHVPGYSHTLSWLKQTHYKSFCVF